MLLAGVITISVVACGGGGQSEAPSEASTETATEYSSSVEEKEDISAETTENATEDTTTVPAVESNYTIVRDVYGMTQEKRHTSHFEYCDFEIDEKGNIISAEVRGDNTHTMTYEYDENNRLIKSTKTTTIYGTEENNWVYDEAGRLIENILIETDKDGETTEKVNTYEYDESGNYISGQRTTNGGDIFLNSYECDEDNRLIKEVETFDGEEEYTYTFSYDGDMINPSFRTEDASWSDSSWSHYDIDVVYDDRDRVVLESVINKEGKKMINEFTYEKIGEVTESPENNPDLIPGDKWTYFGSSLQLPVPSSCVATIKQGDEDNIYYLPTYKGSFSSGFGETYFVPYVTDSSFAFTAVDQYVNILTDVLGYEVKNMGTMIKVLDSNEEEIANLYVEATDGTYCLRVEQ